MAEPGDTGNEAIAAWRRALPPRWSWLAALASPTTYVLVVAFAVTAWAKALVVNDLRLGGIEAAYSLWAISADAAVFFGLAALFAIGEAQRPWIRAITVPLAALLLVIATAGAGYLAVTGEQLSWAAIRLGVARFGDLLIIAGEGASKSAGRIALAMLAAVGVPIAAAAWVRRRAPADPGVRGRGRAHCAAAVAAAGGLLWLALPSPSPLPARRLGGNAAVASYWQWITADPADARERFAGYAPATLATEVEIARLREGRRPNIVVVVLESTRYDVTSLAGDGAPAATPNLRALADRGLSAPTARAALPHTTKSLFSMLCGRLPLMQQALFELAPALEVECLPAALARAGYATGFFQSSVGTFESRPRLASKLGYQEFEAWEDFGHEPLGYLASDDERLVEPLARFLDQARNRPVFATLLTSATHHPYRLSAPARRRAEASGAPVSTPRQRYLRLVEAEDHLLGDVERLLEERGLTDDTILIALGDHGEGFGRKGVRQHDNNFYEEGLRVPFALAGPGVPEGRVEGNASVVDLTPTVLDLVGVTLPAAHAEALAGASLIGGRAPAEPRYFGCYYDNMCRGFVLGDRKVVFLPSRSKAVYFDLAADPDENRPRRLTPALAARLPELHRVIESHQLLARPGDLGALARDYGAWTCPAGEPCAHPRRADGFEPLGAGP